MAPHTFSPAPNSQQFYGFSASLPSASTASKNSTRRKTKNKDLLERPASVYALQKKKGHKKNAHSRVNALSLYPADMTIRTRGSRAASARAY